MMGPAAQLSYDSVRPGAAQLYINTKSWFMQALGGVCRGHLLQALPDVVEWPSTAGDSDRWGLRPFRSHLPRLGWCFPA